MPQDEFEEMIDEDFENMVIRVVKNPYLEENSKGCLHLATHFLRNPDISFTAKGVFMHLAGYHENPVNLETFDLQKKDEEFFEGISELQELGLVTIEDQKIFVKENQELFYKT